MFRVCAVVALTVLALCLTPIRAQGGIVLTEKSESRWRSGVCLFGAASRGELEDVFGTGFGIDVSGVFRLDRSGLFGLRIQGGIIDYGSETTGAPLTGVRPAFGAQITTKRSVTAMGIGPQVSWPRGRLRPYAYALASGAYFNSHADLTGRDSLGRYIVIPGDLNRLAWGAGLGGGATFGITNRVSLDVGSEFRRYGEVRTIGNGAVKMPNGAVFITENRGDLSMILFRAGVTVKLPAGGGRRGRPR